LAADDEREIVGPCGRVLRRVGPEPIHAYTDLDGLAFVDQATPDLLVTDPQWPGDLAAGSMPEGACRPTPVIPITAHDFPDARSTARKSRPEGYRTNPFSNAAFPDAVQRIFVFPASDGRNPRLS
jgi:hypothetical protein